MRLRDEIRVCAIIDKLLKYEEENGMPSDICRVYLRKIEHLYYKYEPRAAKQAMVGVCCYIYHFLVSAGFVKENFSCFYCCYEDIPVPLIIPDTLNGSSS